MAPRINLEKAVSQAVHKYGEPNEAELRTHFTENHIHYPPNELTLLAFKKEKRIELWAQDTDTHHWAKIKAYPLTASSGSLGPKLRENDGQIPEGIYQLTEFNPFSHWHLSIRVDYPNAFDQSQGLTDGRKKLGYDIFIHGKASSAGCLAVGDEAINELFLLTYRVGLDHTQLVIAPNDLRTEKIATDTQNQPKWIHALYKKIKNKLKEYA